MNVRAIIIVDDGKATGNTIKVPAELVHKEHPKKTIVAIPVVLRGAVQNLQESKFIEDVVCLIALDYFYAGGQFHSNFDQVSEEESIRLLEEYYGVTNH